MTTIRKFFSKVSTLALASMLVVASPAINTDSIYASQSSTYTIQSYGETPEPRFGLDNQYNY